MLKWCIILFAGQECAAPLDMIFVIDASGSVGKENFDNMLEFVTTLTSTLNVGPSRTHVGVVRYSESAELLIKLGSISDPTQLDNAIRNIQYSQGPSTATGVAIDLAHQQGFHNSRHSQGIPSVMMVLTDGIYTRGVRPSVPAASAAADGIHILAVGIGSDINIEELNSFASDPTSVFLINSFSQDDFEKAIKPLRDTACTSKYNIHQHAVNILMQAWVLSHFPPHT